MSTNDLTKRENACDIAIRYALRGRSIVELKKLLRNAGASDSVVVAATESFYFTLEHVV